MNTLFPPIAALILIASCGGAQANAAKAAERCEAAVTETIQRMRGREAREVDFAAASRKVAPPVDEETSVKGAGRYRGASNRSTPFSYSCAFNAKTGTTSGVMFRETAAAPASADGAWQPDLSRVSPEACESAVAAVLKEKHPRVGRIVFGSETRRMQPAPNSRIGLDGQGAVQRAPGMHTMPFSYHCEFDAQSGKVVHAQASE
jgi:hypothetical protein